MSSKNFVLAMLQSENLFEFLQKVKHSVLNYFDDENILCIFIDFDIESEHLINILHKNMTIKFHVFSIYDDYDILLDVKNAKNIDKLLSLFNIKEKYEEIDVYYSYYEDYLVFFKKNDITKVLYLLDESDLKDYSKIDKYSQLCEEIFY